MHVRRREDFAGLARRPNELAEIAHGAVDLSPRKPDAHLMYGAFLEGARLATPTFVAPARGAEEAREGRPLAEETCRPSRS